MENKPNDKPEENETNEDAKGAESKQIPKLVGIEEAAEDARRRVAANKENGERAGHLSGAGPEKLDVSGAGAGPEPGRDQAGPEIDIKLVPEKYHKTPARIYERDESGRIVFESKKGKIHPRRKAENRRGRAPNPVAGELLLDGSVYGAKKEPLAGDVVEPGERAEHQRREDAAEPEGPRKIYLSGELFGKVFTHGLDNVTSAMDPKFRMTKEERETASEACGVMADGARIHPAVGLALALGSWIGRVFLVGLFEKRTAAKDAEKRAREDETVKRSEKEAAPAGSGVVVAVSHSADSYPWDME